MTEKILQTGKSIRHILLGLQNTRTFLKVDLKCNTSKGCKMELQEENTIQSQDKMQIKEFHHTRSYTQSQNLARLVSNIDYCAVCSKCNEQFTSKQSCFGHVKICKGCPIAELSCFICRMTFSNKLLLSEHVFKAHDIVLQWFLDKNS